jgi:hypothetical protein
VDFRNLNKACPKDESPLPSMDVLIDSTAGHEMFSFMDGFSGYNQIRMSPKDVRKNSFSDTNRQLLPYCDAIWSKKCRGNVPKDHDHYIP